MARILIIDDSQSVVARLRSALEAAGHETDELGSFLELPAKIRDQPPDLVILDLKMPLLPGEKIAAYIRKYQRRKVPILIHSSAGDEEMQRVAEEIGAAGVLSKGLSPSEIQARIEQCLVVVSAPPPRPGSGS